MATLFLFFALSLAITSPLSSSNSDTLSAGSSLSVEKRDDDVLNSPNGVFSAGFHPVGKNAYYFAVWFNEPLTNVSNYKDRTLTWMANRDQPVNGKRSKLSLLKTCNLILNDAGGFVVWSTAAVSGSVSNLHLNDSGNLVLRSSDGAVLWQSFDSPTDTLLPDQLFTRFGELVSSRSKNNFSSGFYKLLFNNDNVLSLVYDSIQLSSVYWPSPWLVSWDAGRSTYNNSKLAMLDCLGNFSSSDNFTFISDDYGKKIQRRLKLDHDGNLRLYSRENLSGSKWTVSWQAFANPCSIHGVCGPNGLCSYTHDNSRKCSCLPGHKIKNHTDWSYGCEPEFNVTFCTKHDQSRFVKLENTEFYGYDFGFFPNYTLKECEELCLTWCTCKGFQYRFSYNKGYKCYPKTLLANGQHIANFSGDIYLRLPKTYTLSNESLTEFRLDCSNSSTPLARKYTKFHMNELVNSMLWFACGVGGLEIVCVLLVWWLLIKSNQDSSADHMRDYLLAVTGFKRFSFAELKKATKNFAIEIGRGAGGIVYKATLSDNRVAAIKRLSEAYQGEAEFLAEVNIIGRLNHMNLIEMWGYCAEGKHRLLVYEYLEHGSLNENLSGNKLDWKKRYDIAVATAKGLAYLHDECLEWVLHCDVKPQNILLGSDYQPKVADFGLSKLLKRGELSDPTFSRIRGTRGYMAPEWVTNQSITSKADVYSYGIVVLEILTGKSPISWVGHSDADTEADREPRGLVKWVQEMIDGKGEDMASCVGKIMDPSMEDEYDKEKMGKLLGAALKCVEEERDARPSMSQVVEMLQDH